MKPTFIGQLRYVKRIDKQYHEGTSYNNILQQFDGKEWNDVNSAIDKQYHEGTSYNNILQQFDGKEWNDVNSADAVWETPEQEAKYNKAQAKEYIFR